MGATRKYGWQLVSLKQNKMNKLGLVGLTLGHSFSKKYFDNKFQELKLTNYEYNLYPLEDISEILHILKDPEVIGFNVTLPYKQSIIHYLDGLNETAAAVSAVNTVVKQDGKFIGFNTDVWGFATSLFPEVIDNVESAIIIGNGGASKAVQFVLKKLGIPYTIYSRTKTDETESLDDLTYNDLEVNKLIIQTTPVGMFPNNEFHLDIPYDAIGSKHFCIDLVYNPEETYFLQRSRENGAKTKNGMQMLYEQAEESWRIWSSI